MWKRRQLGRACVGGPLAFLLLPPVGRPTTDNSAMSILILIGLEPNAFAMNWQLHRPHRMGHFDMFEDVGALGEWTLNISTLPFILPKHQTSPIEWLSPLIYKDYSASLRSAWTFRQQQSVGTSRQAVACGGIRTDTVRRDLSAAGSVVTSRLHKR